MLGDSRPRPGRTMPAKSVRPGPPCTLPQTRAEFPCHCSPFEAGAGRQAIDIEQFMALMTVNCASESDFSRVSSGPVLSHLTSPASRCQ